MKRSILLTLSICTLASPAFAYVRQDLNDNFQEFIYEQNVQNQLDQIIEEQQRQRYEMEYEQNLNEMIWQQRQQYRQPDGE
jgi:hypothetical protein